jgi:hypothetical protein
MGEAKMGLLRVCFDRRLRLQFQLDSHFSFCQCRKILHFSFVGNEIREVVGA